MSINNPLLYNNDITNEDPRVVALGGPKGAIVKFAPFLGAPVFLMKQDYGETTNWVPISGGGGPGDWSTLGNNGANLVLGTLSNDTWYFIANSQIRGGFKNTGEFFLKTHAGFPNTELSQRTNALQTVGGAFTSLLTIVFPINTTAYATFKCVARESTGAHRAAFERKVLLWSDAVSTTVSDRLHFTFTDKTKDPYDVQMSTSGLNVSFQVRGDVGDIVNWAGSVEYQFV